MEIVAIRMNQMKFNSDRLNFYIFLFQLNFDFQYDMQTLQWQTLQWHFNDMQTLSIWDANTLSQIKWNNW